ncbi:hypothetical protein GCM10010869_69440 [Mesorhizobium tianshanense]|nr:hypothetical protein GCM10010869_69440 [Mesorhizobium tianshanense]
MLPARWLIGKTKAASAASVFVGYDSARKRTLFAPERAEKAIKAMVGKRLTYRRIDEAGHA